MTQDTPLARIQRARDNEPQLIDVLPTLLKAKGVQIKEDVTATSRSARAKKTRHAVGVGSTASSAGISGLDILDRKAHPALVEALSIEPNQQVLVVLIDGMGYYFIQKYLAHTPFLRSRKGDMIRGVTVLPSTTAAAITGFGTGAMPGQTRMVGWSVREGDGIATLLAFDGTSTPPEVWQPVPTCFERARNQGLDCVAVSAPQFARSGLTRAALRGTRQVGGRTWNERMEAALAQLEAGVDIVYMYWSEVDHAGHTFGLASQTWLYELESVDAGLDQLARRLPANTVAVLVADHGMVQTSVDTRIDVAEVPALKQGLTMIAGEGRAVHIHAQPGQDVAELLDRWRGFLGERAVIVERPDLPALLGGEAGARLVGDAMVFMQDNWVVVDSRTQPVGMMTMPGVHGSFSSAEIAVPILRFA